MGWAMPGHMIAGDSKEQQGTYEELAIICHCGQGHEHIGHHS